VKKVKVVADMAGDLFHKGHVQFLMLVRQHFEKDFTLHLTVALHTDEQIAAYKGRHPIQSYDSRKAVLQSCRYVDEVIEAPDEFGKEFADHFDFLAHGDDLLKWDKDMLDKYYKEFIAKDKLVLLPYTQGISTTGLIAIASGSK
jgi:cytidyltransferase-like protein